MRTARGLLTAAGPLLLALFLTSSSHRAQAALRGGGAEAEAEVMPNGGSTIPTPPLIAAAGNNATAELLLVAAQIEDFFALVNNAAGAGDDARKLQQQQGSGATNDPGAQYRTSLAPLWDIYQDPRAVSDRSPSRHWLFPACGFAAPIIESPVYCPLGLVFERVGETVLELNRGAAIVQTRTMYETEKEPAQDYDRAQGGAPRLPVRLADVGHPQPFQITNQSVVEGERHTYYWYIRNILNLYLYVKRCIQADSDRAWPPPLVPHGYAHQRLLFTPREAADGNAPIGQSFVKGDHLVVTMRGTIYRGGWVQDATFRYADPAQTRAAGLAGDIHAGFFSQTMGLVQQLEEELAAHPDVRRVTIAGHSLGAAHSQLVSAVLAIRHPNLEIEAINMGAPPLGSQAFVDQYASLPNLRARNIMYLGDGLMTQAPTPFSIGDVIPQPPGGCWPVRGCPFTHHPDTNLRVKYEATHGIVAFYAKDMPNADGWRQVDQVISARSSVSAAHGCSYLCWATQGLDDPEDRCYFLGQKQNDPWPCPYTRFDD